MFLGVLGEGGEDGRKWEGRMGEEEDGGGEDGGEVEDGGGEDGGGGGWGRKRREDQ